MGTLAQKFWFADKWDEISVEAYQAANDCDTLSFNLQAFKTGDSPSNSQIRAANALNCLIYNSTPLATTTNRESLQKLKGLLQEAVETGLFDAKWCFVKAAFNFMDVVDGHIDRVSSNIPTPPSQT